MLLLPGRDSGGMLEIVPPANPDWLLGKHHCPSIIASWKDISSNIAVSRHHGEVFTPPLAQPRPDAFGQLDERVDGQPDGQPGSGQASSVNECWISPSSLEWLTLKPGRCRGAQMHVSAPGLRRSAW